MANNYLRKGAVVALMLLTVIGMTAAPAMANDTQTSGDDCDLVDVDGDNNKVSVDMENSDVNINCGDDGSAGASGGGGADDASTGGDGSAADDGGQMTVEVNGDKVDTGDQDGTDGADGQDGQDGTDGQQQQQQQQQQDDGADGADGQDGQDGTDGQQQQQQQQQQQDQDTNVEVDTGDGDDAGDGNAEGGDDTAETGDSDNEQNVGDVDNSTVLQFLLDQDFIDQSEVNAAINNENISNSTIVNNIVNGDQTINLTSVYVDNRDTNIDNSTSIVVNNNGTINIVNNDGDGGETPGDGDESEAAPDISVTKNTDADEVELSYDDSAGVLRADEPVTFTVEVTNEGDATANNVVVNDEDVIAEITGLPDETTAFLVTSSSTSQGDFSAVTGEFEVGTLAPGETATLTFDAVAVSTNLELLEGDVASISATNNATLESVSPDDPNGDNNRGSATVELVGLLDIELPGTPTLAPSNQQVSAAGAGGGLPLSGMAIGTMAVTGLLGSVLLFRRTDE